MLLTNSGSYLGHHMQLGKLAATLRAQACKRHADAKILGQLREATGKGRDGRGEANWWDVSLRLRLSRGQLVKNGTRNTWEKMVVEQWAPSQLYRSVPILLVLAIALRAKTATKSGPKNLKQCITMQNQSQSQQRVLWALAHNAAASSVPQMICRGVFQIFLQNPAHNILSPYNPYISMCWTSIALGFLACWCVFQRL